ncbi:MAG TPA: hypothetical protein VJ754_08690, partial [Anaerolineae bacterium]|nr:hypothetical protein [Anaerolineae bacterium]
LKVKEAKPREERGGYQSRLSAFSLAGRAPKVNASKPRKEPSDYQSTLSAFGNCSSGPTGTRRRGEGGSQRHQFAHWRPAKVS